MQTEFMLRWALEKRAQAAAAEADGFDVNPIADSRNCDWRPRPWRDSPCAPDPDMDD